MNECAYEGDGELVTFVSVGGGDGGKRRQGGGKEGRESKCICVCVCVMYGRVDDCGV